MPQPAALPASFTALTGQWGYALNAARPVAPRVDFAAAERRLRGLIANLPQEAATALLRDHTRTSPGEAAAPRLLAERESRDGNFAAAAAWLERALALAPGYGGARRSYVAVLLAMNKPVDALPHVERLVADEPQDCAHRICLAWCLGETGDYDRSIAVYDTVLDEIGEQPRYALHYADTLKYAGHRADAAHVYRSCIAHVPSMGEAWWSLANMKDEILTEAEREAMRAQLARGDLSVQDRIHLHYALGLALEQGCDYAASFTHYAAGAALKRGTLTYSSGELTKLMQRSKAFFTAAFFAGAAGSGCADDAPIFVVGLPRAGSTLIEQILASHSQVEGTRELPEISNIVRDIGIGADGGFHYPECLAAMAPDALAALGQRYIDRTRIYRKSTKPFFIDKMPANWAHAGLIHAILPNAKIIDARRDAMGNCFSAYKQLFGHGVHYSYDLTELGQYYRAYTDRMAQYDAVLPGRIYRVQYEHMVADPEAEIRKLLAHCGLAFEPACLRFWESRRAVATPSSEQVRKPIFRDGLAQWRHYEPWLGKLAKAVAEG
jgi:tetratricopeptide (TPR) repeat protein